MTDEDEKEEVVEIPDDALSPEHSWSHRGEGAIRSWEKRFVLPWLGDWGDCVRYVSWRTGVPVREAIEWIKAQDTYRISASIDGLTDAYDRHAVAENARIDAYREQSVDRKKESDRYYELQERNLRAMERMVPYVEQEVDEMEQGEDWKKGEE